MKPYQSAFLELALAHDVLRFGAFTLKSGRESPYFFNLGRIATGGSLARLADAYAAALTDTGLAFDIVFGPAYKGIPLAAAVAMALAARGHDAGFAYNRKEAKAHGEGGALVGAEVAGRRVVVIDDVLTAGTAMRQAVAQLRQAGAVVVGAVIALDRQERGQGQDSAVAEMTAESGVPVHALVGLDHILEYLARPGGADRLPPGTLDTVRAYRSRHGVAGAGRAPA